MVVPTASLDESNRGPAAVGGSELVGQFEFTLLRPHAGTIDSNPVHGLAARIQANNLIVRLADVFYRANFLTTDASDTIT
jgi:hypothetical protein